MAEVRTERAAVLALVEAQQEYDAALAELRRARRPEPTEREAKRALDEGERLLHESRAAVARAAATFDVAFRMMSRAQTELERALDLSVEAKARALRGDAPNASGSIERAEKLVAEGRDRLLAAGRELRDAREVGRPDPTPGPASRRASG